MKNFKVLLVVVAVSIGFLLSGQPVVQAGDTLEVWPVTPEARGDRSSGTLTIYYEDIGTGCEVPGDTSVKMFFFLRLYEKKAKTWHIISSVDNGPFCLIFDVDTGDQQAALINFFNNAVLPELDPTRGYTSIELKDVDNEYRHISATPYCVIADIVLVAN